MNSQLLESLNRNKAANRKVHTIHLLEATLSNRVDIVFVVLSDSCTNKTTDKRTYNSNHCTFLFAYLFIVQLCPSATLRTCVSEFAHCPAHIEAISWQRKFLLQCFYVFKCCVFSSFDCFALVLNLFKFVFLKINVIAATKQ